MLPTQYAHYGETPLYDGEIYTPAYAQHIDGHHMNAYNRVFRHDDAALELMNLADYDNNERLKHGKYWDGNRDKILGRKHNYKSDYTYGTYNNSDDDQDDNEDDAEENDEGTTADINDDDTEQQQNDDDYQTADADDNNDDTTNDKVDEENELTDDDKLNNDDDEG